PPAILLEDFPVSEELSAFIAKSRKELSDVFAAKDDRIVVVVGPCSIHDPVAALEYARKLKPHADRLAGDLLIVMRVYFEKPRTVVGWKGLINDPYLDNSFHINKGLKIARNLLLDITKLGLPVATEFLDVIMPQFIADLISWAAIGARTTESQVHRELASGLSMPVGFKNGTGGNVQLAIDAVLSARHSHWFPSVTKQGVAAIFETAGNPATHIILRGGSRTGPNYDAKAVAEAVALLEQAGIKNPRLMVDCSHANSNKDYRRQPIVADDLSGQIAAANHHLAGVMIESHLVAGRQDYVKDRAVYGQSITDACISFDDTVPILNRLAEAVRRRRGAK
ncbi:MAG: 3-deoxy-7-phosphoheptulonate synthase, partial [Verrucomicrobiales bacterium]|nr:3-deoxy-7-phosphoheptulonate synthase [Verrucomicrobiales bacterium]